MDTLLVELSAGFIDNPATPDHRTKVEITLKRASGAIEIENKAGIPRSVHAFTLNNPAVLGYGSPQNLTVEHVALLLAISCSLANPRILFSPLQPNLLASVIRFGEIPSKVETIEKPGELSIAVTEVIRITEHVSTVLGTKLSLNEATLMNIVNKLLKYRIFDETNRSRRDLNVLEAIKRYKDALMTAEAISCYGSVRRQAFSDSEADSLSYGFRPSS